MIEDIADQLSRAWKPSAGDRLSFVVGIAGGESHYWLWSEDEGDKTELVESIDPSELIDLFALRREICEAENRLWFSLRLDLSDNGQWSSRLDYQSAVAMLDDYPGSPTDPFSEDQYSNDRRQFLGDGTEHSSEIIPDKEPSRQADSGSDPSEIIPDEEPIPQNPLRDDQQEDPSIDQLANVLAVSDLSLDIRLFLTEALRRYLDKKQKGPSSKPAQPLGGNSVVLDPEPTSFLSKPPANVSLEIVNQLAKVFGRKPEQGQKQGDDSGARAMAAWFHEGHYFLLGVGASLASEEDYEITIAWPGEQGKEVFEGAFDLLDGITGLVTQEGQHFDSFQFLELTEAVAPFAPDQYRGLLFTPDPVFWKPLPCDGRQVKLLRCVPITLDEMERIESSGGHFSARGLALSILENDRWLLFNRWQ
jgi:hypothetical protein